MNTQRQLPSENLHMKPSLTPLLEQVVSSVNLKNEERVFPRMGLVTRGQISRYLDAMQSWMKPASPEEISVRLGMLMEFFYAPSSNEKFQAAAYAHWVTIMQELPSPVFAEVCERWTREMSKRPTPADLLKLGKRIAGDELTDYEILSEAYEQAPDLDGTEPTFDEEGIRLNRAELGGMTDREIDEAIEALKNSDTGRDMVREGYLLDVLHFIRRNHRRPTKGEAMDIKVSVDRMQMRAAKGFDDVDEFHAGVLSRVHTEWQRRAANLEEEVLR